MAKRANRKVSRSSVAAKLPSQPRPPQRSSRHFANPARRPYWIRFESADFTSLCPITGQADFAQITIDYQPARRCLETKSLKFYLASYRNERAFNEAVTNHILDDLVRACDPRKMIVQRGIRLPRRDQPNDYCDLIRTNRRRRAMKRAVVLLSGGLDSATVLAICRADGFESYALSFRYGQRHERELAAAREDRAVVRRERTPDRPESICASSPAPP